MKVLRQVSYQAKRAGVVDAVLMLRLNQDGDDVFVVEFVPYSAVELDGFAAARGQSVAVGANL